MSVWRSLKFGERMRGGLSKISNSALFSDVLELLITRRCAAVPDYFKLYTNELTILWPH